MHEDEDFFSKVYDASGAENIQAVYDDWAHRYDSDVAEQGYTTPKRCARALAKFLPDKSVPILDIGCGTGVSGNALVQEGFSNISGTDINAEMLSIARARGIYEKLWHSSLKDPFAVDLSQFQAVTAIGVIGSGAAPLSLLEELVDRLAQGMLTVFSFNDHSLADPEFGNSISRMIQEGICKELLSEYGPHLIKMKINSRIYVLERL